LAVAQADHVRAEEDLRRLEDALPARPLMPEVGVLQGLQAEARAGAERSLHLETSIQTHEDRAQALEESLRECRVAMEDARHRLQERSEEIQGPGFATAT